VIKALLIYAAAAYLIDVVLRPESIAGRARLAASRRGKPLLNVGCGLPGSSLRVALLGPTGWGDTNCDIASSSSCDLSVRTCFCDITSLPWGDKEFGAVIASHVLEHVEDPQLALNELHRVADEVFVITPAWWAPHTWVHPGHRWYIRADGTSTRLWGWK